MKTSTKILAKNIDTGICYLNGKSISSKTFYQILKQIIPTQPGCKVVDTTSALVYKYN